MITTGFVIRSAAPTFDAACSSPASVQVACGHPSCMRLSRPCSEDVQHDVAVRAWTTLFVGSVAAASLLARSRTVRRSRQFGSRAVAVVQFVFWC